MALEIHNIEALSIRIYESVSVSEKIIVTIIFERLTTWETKLKGTSTLVSIAEYRRLLGDDTSTDKRIVERLQYLEAFCRNIIKPELQTYVQRQK